MSLLKITLALLASLSTVVACSSSSPSSPRSPGEQPFVNQIGLTSTMGEVGRPFRAEVAYSATRLGTPEVTVNNLPEGLYFDAETQEVTGVPMTEGFFTVTLSLRKKAKKGMQARTIENSWFSEQVEVSIYQPIEDKTVKEATKVASSNPQN